MQNSSPLAACQKHILDFSRELLLTIFATDQFGPKLSVVYDSNNEKQEIETKSVRRRKMRINRKRKNGAHVPTKRRKICFRCKRETFGHVTSYYPLVCVSLGYLSGSFYPISHTQRRARVGSLRSFSYIKNEVFATEFHNFLVLKNTTEHIHTDHT